MSHSAFVARGLTRLSKRTILPDMIPLCMFVKCFRFFIAEVRSEVHPTPSNLRGTLNVRKNQMGPSQEDCCDVKMFHLLPWQWQAHCTMLASQLLIVHLLLHSHTHRCPDPWIYSLELGTQSRLWVDHFYTVSKAVYTLCKKWSVLSLDCVSYQLMSQF